MANGAKGAVTVAYLHGEEVAHSWHASIIELIGYDLATNERVIRGGWQSMRPATGDLVGGRNEVVGKFLGDDRAEWLFWVDTDMGFAPDAIDRLVAAADPVERPVVGGLCFAYRETGPDGMGGQHAVPRPTIFDWRGAAAGKECGFVGRTQYPVNALVQCAGTGSACLLIHRTVLEKIGAQFGSWYDRLPDPQGRLVSEDLSFCMRVGAVGVPVFVHTGVRTSHMKTIYVTEEHYWRYAVAPPATEQTAVIVPALLRPQNAEPFMRSLRASTGLATVYAVCEDSDTETVLAWKRAGAETIIGTAHTFAEKVNAGYRASHEPWLFLVGDDVQFLPGWLDHAQSTGGDRLHVIGTNDLGNPRVMAGEHATHLLIRRSYVDEVGSSWDGPGVVCHEGYHHWYVDDEIVTAARQRQVWAMSLGSAVEHMHPEWGKGEVDEVYLLGQSFADVDAKLFERRLRASVRPAA